MRTTAKLIREVEEKIIGKLVDDALAAGYTIKVNNGEEYFGPFSNKEDVFGELFSVDDEHLALYSGETRKGWVFLVHGNGLDVISDYSVGIESIVAGANKLADSYED